MNYSGSQDSSCPTAFVSQKLTDELRKKADQAAKSRISNDMYNRFSSTEKDRIERARIGALGEVCFENILNINKIKYFSDIFDNTSPDTGDFFIPDQSGISIDVKIAKTRKTPDPKWVFGIPIDQSPQKKDLIIIGWWNPGTDTVFFYGSIQGEKLIGRKTTYYNSLTGARYLTKNIEVAWKELNRAIPEIPGFVGDIQR